MATMDVFSGSAFSLLELTGAINKVPYQPGFLGSLDLGSNDFVGLSVESSALRMSDQCPFKTKVLDLLS